MKIIHVIYNKLTGQYIINPGKKDRREFESFDHMKKVLVEENLGRKLKLVTNLSDEDLEELRKYLKIAEIKRGK